MRERARVKGNLVTLCANFQPCGRPETDPLRQAAWLQAGDMGAMLLRELVGNGLLAMPARFLVTHLVADLGMQREVALDLTAKRAYALYCGHNGALGGRAASVAKAFFDAANKEQLMRVLYIDM